MSVSDGQVIDGFNAARLSQLFDGSNEAPGPRIERMLGNRFIVALAPLYCFRVLLRSIAGGFAVADEPCHMIKSALSQARLLGVLTDTWAIEKLLVP